LSPAPQEVCKADRFGVAVDNMGSSVSRSPQASVRTRDLALDMLRGYFLVVIMIDHLRFAANPFYLLSGDQSLWVTAAEGFVLISGFLVGMLRGDQARTEGLAAASRHVLRRAVVLALWCAALTIGFRAISRATGYWPAVPNADAPGGFFDYSFGAISLRRTYGDHNLLAAYALFLAIAPVVLAAMLRRLTWLVLAASAVLWGVAFYYRLAWSNSVQVDLCWQLLFIVGMAAGFHREAIATRLRALSAPARRRFAWSAALASCAILVGSLLRLPINGTARTLFEADFFDRDRLGPGRIVCALILVSSLYAVIRRYEAPLARTVGKLLIPLGQASLYVYIVQSMITFLLVNRTLANPWLAAAITAGVVGGVWIMVKNRVLFGVIPR
jgi:hypothetical protein